MLDELTWERCGKMLSEMAEQGWEVTLAHWKERNSRWICDVQIGNQITDPDFTCESADPLVAISNAYKEWQVFMAAQKIRREQEVAKMKKIDEKEK